MCKWLQYSGVLVLMVTKMCPGKKEEGGGKASGRPASRLPSRKPTRQTDCHHLACMRERQAADTPEMQSESLSVLWLSQTHYDFVFVSGVSSELLCSPHVC